MPPNLHFGGATMKKIITFLLAFTMIVSLSACGGSGNSASGTDSVQIICDVTKYANISSSELVEILGDPDDISETTSATGFVEIPCTYYDYYGAEELGDVSFLLVNDTVVKFTAYNEFPFYKKNDDLLASLNVTKSDSCAMAANTETALRFRCVTDEIDDLWVTNIEGDNYGFLAVTYDMLYFEEWYLPLSTSEEAKYQVLTQDYVKTILKAPKSADFPNITKWAIVKNNFYVVAQSYVDAINSFGAEVRSDFTFIYPVGTGTPIYAVFDGEVIVDNGYTPTADLVKQLVVEKAKDIDLQTDKQDIISETAPSINNEVSASTTPQSTPTQTSEITPNNAENNKPTQNTNNLSDLEYIVHNTCERYNSGDTRFDGQLYVTVDSPTSITLEHYVRELIPASEEYILYQMEDILKNTFSEILNDVFPEPIEVYVYTTATIVDDSYLEDDDEILDPDVIATDNTIENNPTVVDWISAEQLKNDYGLSYWWNGEEIQLFNDSCRYIISGSPKSSFEQDKVYTGSCNGNSVRFKYSRVTSYNEGNIFFYYDDIIFAGII